MFNAHAETHKEPIMNTAVNKLFYSGMNGYKTMSAAAAVLVTGLILIWFYAVAQTAQSHATLSDDHRITVTATRLVAAPAGHATQKLAAVERNVTAR